MTEYIFEMKHPIAHFTIFPSMDKNGEAKLNASVTINDGQVLTEWCDMREREYTGNWIIRYFEQLDMAMLWIYLTSLKLGIWKNEQFRIFLENFRRSLDRA